MEASQIITKARAAMILEAPFFGTLALKLAIKEASEKVETCATDMKHIFYNSKYVLKISKQELMGVAAHEVMHCVGNHAGRRQNREHQLWNIACDYAINPIVINSGVILPDGALIDPKYKNKTSEHIYS